MPASKPRPAAASPVVVELGAAVLDESVEMVAIKHHVHRVIKWMTADVQLGGADKKRLLDGLAFAESHGRESSVNRDWQFTPALHGFQWISGFSHGLLERPHFQMYCPFRAEDCAWVGRQVRSAASKGVDDAKAL